MRAAAVFLFALLMAPVRLRIGMSADHHHLASGNIDICIYGFSFVLPFRVLRPEKNGSFFFQIGNHKPTRIGFSPKNYKKPGKRLGNQIRAWRAETAFSIALRLNLGDAFWTALACGALQAAFSGLPQVAAAVHPVYGKAGFTLQVHCISVFRLGKLFLTALLVGLDRLSPKTAGGAANGNHSKSAN